MRRIRLDIEYDGTRYAGWQRQSNALAVQQCLEEALCALTGERAVITGASRTDAGVHALKQVAHCDVVSPIPDDKLFLALNTKLAPDIRVKRSMLVAPDFHARFHCVQKAYCYQIHNAQVASALGRQRSFHVPRALDIDVMQRALAAMVGTHDFAAFQAAGANPVKSTVRTVFDACLQKRNDNIFIWILGNGFLYNMVRILAGTLCYVGQGMLSENGIENALATRSRPDLGPTAPPQGLTLLGAFYQGEEGQARGMMGRAPWE